MEIWEGPGSEGPLSWIVCDHHQWHRVQVDALKLNESLKERRELARAQLPAEPPVDAANDIAVVLVRVRLPGGATQQRRFLPEAKVEDVAAWVSTLDEMPVSAAAGSWRLVTSFPRSEPSGDCSVRELAAGTNACAVFVELN